MIRNNRIGTTHLVEMFLDGPLNNVMFFCWWEILKRNRKHQWCQKVFCLFLYVDHLFFKLILMVLLSMFLIKWSLYHILADFWWLLSFPRCKNETNQNVEILFQVWFFFFRFLMKFPTKGTNAQNDYFLF
jgi:hypothetical protein